MNLRTKFYEILFEPGEGVCWGAQPYETRVQPVEKALLNADMNFVCINPLWLDKDLSPSKPTHSALVGRRADVNITSYRNILIELDKGNLDEQRRILEEAKVPYSTLVFSGGKSLHAIISLGEPCADRAAYKQVVSRVYNRVGRQLLDVSVSNPSRFTRAPQALRNGVRQEILSVSSRVTHGALEEWLGPVEATVVELRPSFPGARILRPSTDYFLAFGSPEGGWNNALFRAAADMTRAGYSKYEIEEQCRRPTGYLDEKDLRTIESAVRAASHDSAV